MQANEGALLEGYFIILLAYSDRVTELCPEGEYHKIFPDYSQKYEDNYQAFNWEEFKDSEEFGEFSKALIDAEVVYSVYIFSVPGH